MSNKVVNYIRQDEPLKALWEAANIIEHDIGCWKEVLRKAGDNEFIRTWSSTRIESLRVDVDRIYEAILEKERRR